MTASNYASHETIKYVLAVMSGKGGVGRSLVTCLLAIALRSHKLRVGILDADLTGPSIAHMFGIESHLSLSDNGKVEPLVSSGGIKVMSMNMFLEDETAPLGWYGPMIASTLRQFYKDAEWGDLDYLLVDLPAGTSDGAM